MTLPAVVRAEYRGEFKIKLPFNDGVERTIDFSDWLTGPVFEPLRDPSTVVWPNGADIAPETLHERARSAA